MNRSRAARNVGLIVLIAAAVAIRVWGSSEPKCERAPEDGPGVSRVDLGARVLSVAAGPKGLWAVRQHDVGKQESELVELDPATGKIKGRAIGLPALGFVGVGKEAVWVVTSRITAHPRGILHRVDPRTHLIVSSLRMGRGTNSVSEGEGGVWVANTAQGSIVRVDPSGRRVTTTVRIEDGPELVLARDGGVWVGSGFGVGNAHRIDPSTGSLTGDIQGTLANVGAGAVWVIRNGPPNGQILRIDPTTLRPVGPILGLDILPATVGIAGRDVWVGKYFQYCAPNSRGDGGDPPISMGWFRIDPVTLKPLSGPVHVGHNPRSPVFASGAFWIVPDNPGNELIRIDLATAAKVRP